MKSFPAPLAFVWDKGNLDKNEKRHKVNFLDCERVFFDKSIKIFEDPGHSKTEKRFLVYGQTDKGRKLTIVFTIRGQKIRVISARDQNKKERRIYEA